MKSTLPIRLFSGFVRLTGLVPALIFFKPRVKLENERASRHLPKHAILVSNHTSLMDFVLYLVVFPWRTVRFLMAEVLFNKGKLFATFLTLLGGIRVDRNTFDFEFVSDALDILDHGGTLGVFPQGRLPVGGKPFPFTVSTAFIALQTDAPIIPVYTDGRYGLNKRAGVVIGEPLYLHEYKKDELSDDEQLNHLTALLEERVYALADRLNTKETTA